MSRFVPVSQLNTFISKWTIKARIVDKTTTTFKKSNGDQGKILSIDVMDKDGDAIKAKFWDAAADKFEEILQKGSVYTFKNGRLSVANKRYNNLPHNYELSFNSDATIELTEDDTHIPVNQKFNFISLRDVKTSNRELPYLFDLLAVVHQSRDCEQVQSKKGEMLNKRQVSLVDSTGYSFDVTLWNEHAQLPDSNFVTGTVVAIHNLSVREYRGKQGQSQRSTILNFEYESDEAKQLKDWYLQNKHDSFTSMVELNPAGADGQPQRSNESMCLKHIFNDLETLTSNDKFYQFVANTQRYYYKSRDGDFTATYSACSACRRKVTTSESNGFCENCGKEVSIDHRYMFVVTFCDWSAGGFGCRAFHDAGVLLLNENANTMHEWSVSGGTDKLNVKKSFEHDTTWKAAKVRIRARLDNYQGQPRKAVLISQLELLDVSSHTTEMLKYIKSKVANILTFETSRKQSRRGNSTPPTSVPTDEKSEEGDSPENKRYQPMKVE